jgi:hypothetical protein
MSENNIEQNLLKMGLGKYIVYAPDGKTIITVLNSALAARQKVTDDQLEALKLSHQLRWELFEAAKKVLDEPLKLKLLASTFDALENEQQRLWNFPVDPNHHRFFDFPGCTCPKMDNAERLGTPYKIHAANCPIHLDGNQPEPQHR